MSGILCVHTSEGNHALIPSQITAFVRSHLKGPLAGYPPQPVDNLAVGLGTGVRALLAHAGSAPSTPEAERASFLVLGSMADSPREGRLARYPDFTQLTDMASESVGGKVSGDLMEDSSPHTHAADHLPHGREPGDNGKDQPQGSVYSRKPIIAKGFQNFKKK